ATGVNVCESKHTMSKLGACLLVAALVGLTCLALACDLQCGLQDSTQSTSSGLCHPDGPRPAAPKHDAQARDVAKAPPVLPFPDGAIPVCFDRLHSHETESAFHSIPVVASPASLVLRI